MLKNSSTKLKKVVTLISTNFQLFSHAQVLIAKQQLRTFNLGCVIDKSTSSH